MSTLLTTSLLFPSSPLLHSLSNSLLFPAFPLLPVFLFCFPSPAGTTSWSPLPPPFHSSFKSIFFPLPTFLFSLSWLGRGGAISPSQSPPPLCALLSPSYPPFPRSISFLLCISPPPLRTLLAPAFLIPLGLFHLLSLSLLSTRHLQTLTPKAASPHLHTSPSAVSLRPCTKPPEPQRGRAPGAGPRSPCPGAVGAAGTRDLPLQRRRLRAQSATAASADVNNASSRCQATKAEAISRKPRAAPARARPGSSRRLFRPDCGREASGPP